MLVLCAAHRVARHADLKAASTCCLLQLGISPQCLARRQPSLPNMLLGQSARSCQAHSQHVLPAAAPVTRPSDTKLCARQGTMPLRLASEKRSEGVEDCCIVCACHRLNEVRWNSPQQVVDARYGAEVKQEPRSLKRSELGNEVQ